MGFHNPNNQNHWGNNLAGSEWFNNQQNQQQFNYGNPNDINYGDLIGQQIIQLEPSPAKAKLDELRQRGEPF